MLNQLSINDFAIIEKTMIDFKEGMTVITGQTGAGKSIVIDAISQLLGARTNKTMVKDDKDYAYIEGVFLLNDKLENYLKDNDVVLDDDYLIISKKISKDLKSQIRLNNRIITNDLCKNIGSHLLEIHSQQSNTYFNHPQTQLDYIDSFFTNDQKQIKANYQQAYKSYQALLKEKDHLFKSAIDPDLLPFYQEQLKDITDNMIEEEEVSALEEKEQFYKNYEKISEGFNAIFNEISNKDVISSLKEINHAIQGISSYSPSIEAYATSFESLYYELIDIIENLKQEYYALDYDENDYELIKDRLFNYQKMIRKYAYSNDEVTKKIEELHGRIDFILNSDKVLSNLDKKINEQLSILKDYANQLDTIRKVYAKDIEEKVLVQLNDLYLKDAKFKIEFTSNKDFSINGQSSITFMFSANKGSSLKPLNMVASGGEMARLVLGLKVIEADLDNRMYIFDEVDTGVSGEVANAIGKKLKQISKNNPVIVITHLPQVAVYANQHLFISKANNDQFTTSNTSYLDKDQQIAQIASMLSANDITQAALDNAKILYENAQNE